MLVEVSVYMRPRIFLAFFLIEAMCVDRIAGELPIENSQHSFSLITDVFKMAAPAEIR